MEVQSTRALRKVVGVACIGLRLRRLEIIWTEEPTSCRHFFAERRELRLPEAAPRSPEGVRRAAIVARAATQQNGLNTSGPKLRRLRLAPLS